MRFFAFFAVFFLISGFAQAAGSFQGATPWQEGYGYKVRIIPGGLKPNGHFSAALDIKLDEGWKTYWRVPGENGIPPALHFEKSRNLEDIVIHWPKPVLFKDGDGQSIGYKERLVLPFELKPYSSNTPVHLVIDTFFGVCAEICVPADASFALELRADNADPKAAILIEEAMQEVPGAPAPHGLDVQVVKLVSEGGDDFVSIDVQVPANLQSKLETAHNDLLVILEGPKDWYFTPLKISGETLDKTLDRPSGMVSAMVPVHRERIGDLPAHLRATIVAGDDAIDTMVPLTH
ncbi:MAG: protein-disulfide reductase DsbD domain-containing protein [Pseudomonadota bacterium]